MTDEIMLSLSLFATADRWRDRVNSAPLQDWERRVIITLSNDDDMMESDWTPNVEAIASALGIDGLAVCRALITGIESGVLCDDYRPDFYETATRVPS